MADRVNLSIPEELIKQAKIYALEQGKSLSTIVESYLRKLVADRLIDSNKDPNEPKKTGIEWIDELQGSITLKDNRPFKEIIGEMKMKKLIDEDIS